MARLIGQRPDESDYALNLMHQFVMEQLPDYICASFFLPLVSKNTNVKYECDMILFIPHMGVFILDISHVSHLGYSSFRTFVRSFSDHNS